MLNNLGVHHATGVRKALEARGVRIVYMLPYSPEVNPIELAWYQVCASLMAPGYAYELDVFRNGVRGMTRGRALAQSNNGFAQGCQSLYLSPPGLVDVRVLPSTPMSVSPNPIWNWWTIETLQDDGLTLRDTVDFTAAPGTFTTIPYTNELWDSGEFIHVGNSFQATTTRNVQACASLWAPGADFELDLFVNDTVRERALAASTSNFANGCRSIGLDAGDRVSVGIYHGGPSPVQVPPNPFWNWLTLN